MTAATLDVAAYTQGEPFQREKRSLFGRTWLPFCAGRQVAKAGDFVSHSFGGWPLFVVRGKDEVLRAFHNVCRHQQMPVVEKPAGRCDMLRCRYHGWTYDLTGQLAAAPPMVAPADPKSVRLGAIDVTEAGPLVFVRLEAGAEAPPAIDLGGLAFAAAVSTDVACNWKTYVEAMLAGPTWRLVWPVALQGRIQGLSVLRQVVPRSFSRTRVIDLVFADGPLDEAMPAQLAAVGAADKAEAEARQAQREAGSFGDAGPALAEFRARAAAAAATEPAAP